MTSDRAMEILRCMANGVDPITGEVLEPGHICNSPDVIRALCMAAYAMSGAADAPASACKAEKLNAGRPWTVEDLDALEHMYRGGASMAWICKRLQRRERGVLKQLVYLGLAEDKAVSDKQPSPGLERAGLRWTREEDTLLRELYAERRPIEEIAARMRRTSYSIYCRMEKLEIFDSGYGYPSGEAPPKWNGEDDRLLREMFLSGIPAGELAAHFQCSEDGIRARLFYMGLCRDAPAAASQRKK